MPKTNTHTCTLVHSTSIIDDDLKYKESKACATDEKQELGFDLSILHKSELEKNLKKERY